MRNIENLAAKETDFFSQELVETKPELKGKWILILNSLSGQKQKSSGIKMLQNV